MSLSNLERSLAEANRAFADGNYDLARAAYIEHIFWMGGSQMPSLDTYLKIGYCHGRLDDMERAHQTLDGVVMESGDEVYRGLANVALAEIYLEKALELPFNDSKRLNRLKNAGDHASEHLGRAIRQLTIVNNKEAD